MKSLVTGVASNDRFGSNSAADRLLKGLSRASAVPQKGDHARAPAQVVDWVPGSVLLNRFRTGPLNV